MTIRTSAIHGRSIGDVVTMSGVGVAGYNGTFTITGTPTTRTFQYTAVAGLGRLRWRNCYFQFTVPGSDWW